MSRIPHIARLIIVITLCAVGVGAISGIEQTRAALGNFAHGTTLAMTAAAPSIHSFDAGPVSFAFHPAGGGVERTKVALKGVISVPHAAGRHPVVLIMHGKHEECEKMPSTGEDLLGQSSARVRDLVFSCPAGSREFPSYRGFGYLIRSLVRAGFAVVSIDANGAALVEDPPRDPGRTVSIQTLLNDERQGVIFRADIVRSTLDRLAVAARGGVDHFGVSLRNRLDLDRVGLVGHSRGGEGVVSAAQLHSRSYRVRGVFVLSPTDEFHELVPGDVAFGSLVSYCDDDVQTLQGVQYFDQAVARPHTQPRDETVLLGANHNFFNDRWRDEWAGHEAHGWCDAPHSPGSGRLTRGGQEKVAARTVKAFMLRHVAGGDHPSPAPVGPKDAISSFSPPSREQRLLATAAPSTPLTSGQSGVRIAPHGLGGFRYCTQATGPSSSAGNKGCGHGLFDRGSSVYRADWSKSGASLSFDLPGRIGDLSRYRDLELRVATPPASTPFGKPDPSVLTTVGHAQALDVELFDASGHAVGVTVGGAQSALRYPLGSPQTAKAVLGAITIPLASFAPVDLTQVRRISVLFDHNARGTVYMDDLAAIR